MAIESLSDIVKSGNSAFSGGGGSSIIVSDTAPGSPVDNSSWLDSTTGTIYFRYANGGNPCWIDTSNTDVLAARNFNRRIRIISGSGTILCDWSKYDEIRITLTGDSSLNFVSATAGQGCTLKIRQDAVGNRNLTLPNSVRYSNDLLGYTNTKDIDKSDRLGFIYDSSDSKYDFVSILKGL